MMRSDFLFALASLLPFLWASCTNNNGKPELKASAEARAVTARYLGPMGYVITNDKAFAFYRSQADHEKDWSPVGTFRREGWIEWERMGTGFVVARQCKGTLVRMDLQKAERKGAELRLHYGLAVTSRDSAVSGFGFFWIAENIAEIRKIHFIENGERVKTLAIGDS